MGVRIRGTLGDRDPLNKVPFKRAISRVKPFCYLGLYRILDRFLEGFYQGACSGLRLDG